MQHKNGKLIVLSGALAATLLHLPALAQAARSPDQKADVIKAASQGTPEDVAAVLDCVQPAEAKEAKVIDFDAGSSTARLAVNLGSGRFTLATIKTWGQDGDDRPLSPVIEAARIMQGKLHFFSRQLNSNPTSAPDEFLITTEMGGGIVCWAKPGWMVQDTNTPVAGAAKPPIAPATTGEGPPAVVSPASATGAPTSVVPTTSPGEAQPARLGRPRTPSRRGEPADAAAAAR